MTDDKTQDEQVSDLLDRFAPEELDPELEAYLEESDEFGWTMIRHPLVYSVIHTDQLNKQVNKMLKYKKEALERALQEENWHTYVYLHERAYRIDAFIEIEDVLPDETYWELLGQIWTDSENIYQNEEQWRDLLTSPRPGHEAMMSDDEKTALAEDPADEFPIYRGFIREGREQGLSWSTNSITAKWFARRLAQDGDTPRLATGTVSKADVIAFFDGRSETEIVVLPENVRNIEITEVKKEQEIGK